MINARTTVHSLHTDSGDAFMHVRDDSYGTLRVWTSCYKQPTYLLQIEMQVEFIQFDNERCEQEFFDTQDLEGYTITKITPIDK